MSLPTLLRSAILLLILFAAPAFATFQRLDKLTIDGQEATLITTPLQSWREKDPQSVLNRAYGGTGNRRGHIATWEIRGDRLLLKKIEAMVKTSEGKVVDGEVVALVFPRRKSSLADWFSGTLVIVEDPFRKGLANNPDSYPSYRLFTVRNGLIVKRQNMQPQEFKDYRKRQFAAFRETEVFRTELRERMDDKSHPVTEARAVELLYAGAAEYYLERDFPAPPSIPTLVVPDKQR